MENKKRLLYTITVMEDIEESEVAGINERIQDPEYLTEYEMMATEAISDMFVGDVEVIIEYGWVEEI